METNIEKRIRKGLIKRLLLVQKQMKRDLFIEVDAESRVLSININNHYLKH